MRRLLPLAGLVFVSACAQRASNAAPTTAVAPPSRGALRALPYAVMVVGAPVTAPPTTVPTRSTDREATAVGTVTGRVLDHAGEPVVAATVRWFVGCGGPDGQATTDSAGRFVMNDVPAEVEWLSIDRAHVQRGEGARVDVRVGDTVSLEVRLEPEASLEVTLDRPAASGELALMEVLEPGRWVPGIRVEGVRWVSVELEEADVVVVDGVWTGRQHLYLQVMEPETGELVGWAETTVELAPGVNRVALHVERPAVVEGRVLDPSGRPVAEARLQAVPCDPGRAGLDHDYSNVDNRWHVAGEDGAYRMVLPAGTWRVVATPADGPGPRAERRVHAPQGATKVVDLTLSVGRAITARCVPPLEEGADVDVSGPPGVSLEILDHSTLEIGGLLDGDRVNLIVRGERRGVHAVLAVGAPEVTVALVPLATFDARVDTRAGPTGARVRVSLLPVWPERFPGSATGRVGGRVYAYPWGEPVSGGDDGWTDERGQVTLECVVPGLHEVWIDGERREGLLEIEPDGRHARTFVVPAR